MRKFVFAACIVVLFAPACSREYAEAPAVKEFLKSDPDAAGGVAAVRAYNKALILAYASNDTGQLTPYAADRELNKVGHLIQGLLAQDLRMDAELKRMRIEKIERWGENNVVITTRETWKYRRVNVKTGKEEKPLTDIEYRLRYNTLREDGHTWKVFDLSPV